MEQNEEVTARFMNEKDFRDTVSQHLLKQVYEHLRSSEQKDSGAR